MGDEMAVFCQFEQVGVVKIRQAGFSLHLLPI